MQEFIRDGKTHVHVIPDDDFIHVCITENYDEQNRILLRVPLHCYEKLASYKRINALVKYAKANQILSPCPAPAVPSDDGDGASLLTVELFKSDLSLICRLLDKHYSTLRNSDFEQDNIDAIEVKQTVQQLTKTVFVGNLIKPMRTYPHQLPTNLE